MDRLNDILTALSHLDLEGSIIQTGNIQAALGATCEVYAAWSTKHKCSVAVKRIRVLLREDEKFAKKLAREIRIWASLEHENVLPFLGFFVEDQGVMPNLVSSYMEKGTVDVFMKQYPRGGKETTDMLAGIAAGLDYLHVCEVIHADLKSGNILVSRDNQPLLADFGISRTLTFSRTASLTHSVRGTVRWMAIELLQDEEEEADSEPEDEDEREPPIVHTKATDVWAFGMVGLELLSGNIPWGHKSDARVSVLIREGKIPSKPANKNKLNEFDPIWELCQSCWDADPEIRPSASYLSNLLHGLRDLLPVLTASDTSATLNLYSPQRDVPISTGEPTIISPRNPGMSSFPTSVPPLCAYYGTEGSTQEIPPPLMDLRVHNSAPAAPNGPPTNVGLAIGGAGAAGPITRPTPHSPPATGSTTSTAPAALADSVPSRSPSPSYARMRPQAGRLLASVLPRVARRQLGGQPVHAKFTE